MLVGYSLEKATNGLLRAALHRVFSKGGSRRSIVFHVRAPSSLKVFPAELIPPPLLGEELDEDEVAARAPFLVSDLIARFDATHSSVNAPVPRAAELSTFGMDLREYYPLPALPLNLLLLIMVEIDITASLARLASKCIYLRALASREELWVPLAERCRIDWNLALDRIDDGTPSIGRGVSGADSIRARDPAALLQAVGQRWPSTIGAELDERTHLNDTIQAMVTTEDGNEICFVLKFSTQVSKMMNAFCQRQGASHNGTTRCASSSATIV